MLAGRSPKESRKRASELLEAVGLGGRLAFRPDRLSGGEQQRVAIAGAAASDPLAELDVLTIPAVAQPASRKANRIVIRFKLNGDRDTSSHPQAAELKAA